MCFHVLILMYTNRRPPMPSLGHPALLSWPYQWLCCCWASQVPPVLHPDRPLSFRERRLVSYLGEELPRGSQDFRAGVYHFQILPDRRGALGVFMIQASNHMFEAPQETVFLHSFVSHFRTSCLRCSSPAQNSDAFRCKIGQKFLFWKSAHTFAFDLSSIYWEESLLG